MWSEQKIKQTIQNLHEVLQHVLEMLLMTNVVSLDIMVL